MDVGFIGLGNMGRQIVDAQLDAGLGMTLWARRAASLEPWAGRDVSVAANPAEVGAASDVVGICVWDEADVDQVLLGDEGVLAGLRPGGVVAIHSTISPGACQRLEAEARRAGGGLVDAPVSVGANFPRLLVMVGGDADTVERCRPALDAFGDPVLHLGAVGAGQVAKLVNNTLLAGQVGLGRSAVELGTALGLDAGALIAALSTGSSRGTWGTFVTERTTADAALAGRTMEWARKDVGLTIDLAAASGVDDDLAVLRMGATGADVVDRRAGTGEPG